MKRTKNGYFWAFEQQEQWEEIAEEKTTQLDEILNVHLEWLKTHQTAHDLLCWKKPQLDFSKKSNVEYAVTINENVELEPVDVENDSIEIFENNTQVKVDFVEGTSSSQDNQINKIDYEINEEENKEIEEIAEAEDIKEINATEDIKEINETEEINDSEDLEETKETENRIEKVVVESTIKVKEMEETKENKKTKENESDQLDEKVDSNRLEKKEVLSDYDEHEDEIQIVVSTRPVKRPQSSFMSRLFKSTKEKVEKKKTEEEIQVSEVMPERPFKQPRLENKKDEVDVINGEEQDSSKIPSWAVSPELEIHLQNQSNLEPDKIFGRLPPLQMQDIFPSHV